MKLAWISPKWPLPADDGAKQATASLVRGVCSLGAEVDLFALTDSPAAHRVDDAREQLRVRAAHLIPRSPTPPSGWRRALSLAVALLRSPLSPITITRYRSPLLRELISAELVRTDKPYDAIVYDGLHGAAHALSGRSLKFPNNWPAIVYRAHNRESLIWERRKTLAEGALIRAAWEIQAEAVAAVEDSLVSASCLVAPVSEADAGLFRLVAPPETSIAMVPIGLPFDTPQPFPTAADAPFLFIGRLDWGPNREGLTWFLDKVWPVVIEARPAALLEIVGSGDASWLDPYRARPGLRILGRVPDVTEVYARCKGSIVPLFYGGGTRVKAIEASRFQRPCLSTAIGVEGLNLIPGHSYLRAETVQEWTELLLSVEDPTLKVVGTAAYRELSRIYGPEAAAERFVRALSSSLR